MNKVLPYIVIAILLGTVTMVVPYALLGPSDYTSLTEEDTFGMLPPPESTTEPEKLDNQERASIEGGYFESVPSEPPKLESPPEETPTTAEPPETEEPEQEAPAQAFGETDLILESLSKLSSIGLMIIPSFLIALGAFIYLKKRIS